MKKIILLFILFVINVNAQTVEVNNPVHPESFFSPQELIKGVLIDNECGQVDNFQASVFGDQNDLQNKSYGFFKKKAGSNFPFEEGIVLSSGRASSIGANNTPFLNFRFPQFLNDDDLSEALGVPSILISDASSIEFDFVSQSNKISFKYLMASEEYEDPFPCFISDGFAFLLKSEDETEYTNIAVLPGTDTPVSVTNVHDNIVGGCSAENQEYFAGYNIGDTNFNGRTVVLTAETEVIPNKRYHMKLVVADYTDNKYDTAIFLESGSFNIGLDLGENATVSGSNAICNNEKLLSANVNASSYKWYKDGIEISGETSKEYLANLGNGIYTCEINNGGCFVKDNITLEFTSPPTNNSSISDFIVTNGNSIVDLSSKTDEILSGQDNNTYDVLYFSDQNLENKINEPNKYVATDNEIIYVEIINTEALVGTANIACSVNSSFVIRIIDFMPNSSDYIVCDDMASGSSSDGRYSSFDLSSKDNEILGTLPPSEYSITYYTTQIGAATGLISDSIDKNNYYTNEIINEQVIYARIVYNIDSSIFFASNITSTLFKPFKLIVNPLPLVNNTIEFIQCDTDFDSSSEINLEIAQQSISSNYMNERFKYYTSETDAIADTSEITIVNNYTANDGDIIWVRTISTEGCYRISQIEVLISFTGNINYTNEFKQCDDLLDINGDNTENNDDEDGITFFNLSSVTTDVKNLYSTTSQNDLEILVFEAIDDRNILNNPIVDLANYRNKNIPAEIPQILYIKVINKINNSCEGLGEFTILAERIPKFEIESPQILCLNATPLIVEIINNNNFNYSWIKKGNPATVISKAYHANIYEEGEYEITIFDTTTNNTCEFSQTLEVIASSSATIDANAITVVDDSSNNSITVDTTNLGEGDYLFALSDDTKTIRDYQTEPYFENLGGGIYTVSVKDIFNCGFPAEIQVSIVEFPNFFTPNNDGFNDTWSVKGLNNSFYSTSNINIFDRYGKKIAELELESEGWNGLFNGKPLPSNDYWYTIQLVGSNGNIRNKKGHFSLLRK